MDTLVDHPIEVVYDVALIILIIAIIGAIIVYVKRRNKISSISLVAIGLIAFLFMSFLGASQVSRSDLTPLKHQYYSTYTVAKDNVDVYKIGSKSYSKDGTDGSQRADIQASVGSKAKYRVEVITYGLSKAKKQAWSHSLNLSKVMAAHLDMKQYVVKINN